MGRAQKRLIEKSKKKLAKSKKIPKEDKQKVLDAYDKVNWNYIYNDPDAMADIMNNPAHLINYVIPEEEDEVTDNGDIVDERRT